jgi:asparagine synthase (glutamine-hydrolysing)
MCGIAGIINLSEKKDNYFEVNKMLNTISHRGIKASVRHFEQLTIGFTRLPITNINEGQPYLDEWVIYLNGEIYNYKDLGAGNELEVISKGLKHEGLPFINKLNGMFVIVAIHGEDVFIIRDRYGIKPMYYTIKNNQFIFSSEIKAILTQIKPNLNERSVKSWLAYQNYFNNETLIQDVYQLESGTITHINKGVKTYKYWEWKYQTKEISFEEAVNKVRELVIQAIKRQIPNEVEFGTCLSGGIDSNIIALNLPDCKTFTVGFKGVEDETELAKIHSKEHYEIIYDKVKYLDETICHLDDLRVGASWSNYGLYQLASKYVKVLFDGAGSDELFGGYVWRHDMAKDYEKHILQRTSFEGEYKFYPDSLMKRMKFDAENFLQGVLSVVDRLSMAHTIEVRVPFLDNDLVDYVLTLPLEYLKDKILLKKAFPELGEKILTSPKKGFSSPDWIEGEGKQADKWSVKALELYTKYHIDAHK